MYKLNYVATFCGDNPAVAQDCNLADRREIALVAMERTRTPMVVTDPRQPDNPIILANQAFIDLTGFESHEIIGKNCRFLQGHDTLQPDVEKLKLAIARGDNRIETELLNYRKDGSAFINALMISAIRGDDGELLYYFASQEDVTTERRAQELEASERRLLMEVDHRTLNALALIQSIVRLSRAEDVQGLSRSINRRIEALGRTHKLLAERRWRSVSLTDLINAQLASHDVIADRVVFEGHSAELRPQVVQPLGLVIHELLSNAQTHGALTEDEGVIDLKCQVEDGALVIHWREPVKAKQISSIVEGFGLQIVRTVVEHQLGGHRNFEVANDVLNATIVVPDAVVSAA